MVPGSAMSRSRRWIMVSALLVLTGVAVWQSSRSFPAPPAVNWATVPRLDLVTAALYLDVQEGGPGLALQHLAELARRDTAINALGHAYAHEVGRYALARNRWDPTVYAECTPRFRAGCYHGLVEAHVNHAPRLDPAELGQLCDRIVGPVTREVARRECAHGLGHGLWFRLHGSYRDALSYCDRLTAPAAQEECRDGIFMQRAGPGATHTHGSSASAPVSLNCGDEPVRYRRACWHYQGRLFVPVGGYPRAFGECDAAAEYVSICYWGLGKWVAGQVTSAGGTDEQIIALCRKGQGGMLGACLAGAVEALVDENWTMARAERFCRASPSGGKVDCYAKLGERIGILYPTSTERSRACGAVEPGYRATCEKSTQGR
jgi:hypothetical protein